ncbi:hypothetical protein AAFF_G00213850 [Aldrovandia affinis]|uniref:Uncharacterized protein n=1 Tax=Aldrovandia affinis TaxID=143900 RepID=A0AAD7W4X8_9TELE|nr:hypothetical protein AAFF_G00213850 [Aldrovandia affinis]
MSAALPDDSALQVHAPKPCPPTRDKPARQAYIALFQCHISFDAPFLATPGTETRRRARGFSKRAKMRQNTTSAAPPIPKLLDPGLRRGTQPSGRSGPAG